MTCYEPKVSVIIPVYNVERYLRKCLDSVVGQTLQEIEIICVNDGSTDDSAAILKEYEKADSRIIVISQENQGLSAARNSGMRRAHGEYIYFLDSDDYIDGDALKTLVRLADERDADSVHFATKPFYESDELRRMNCLDGYFDMRGFSGVFSGPEYIRTAREKYVYTAPVWLVLWRRALLSDNGIAFINGILHEDEPFTFMADLISNRIVVLPTVFHHYRIRSASIKTSQITHKNVIGLFRGGIALLERGLTGTYDAEAALEIREAYSRLISDTAFKYILLPPEEQAKVFFPKELENELFKQIIANSGEDYRQAMKQLQYDLDCVHNSVSFRVGRAITWAPRKVRGGVRCLKEHGTAYTVNRFFEHIRCKH